MLEQWKAFPEIFAGGGKREQSAAVEHQKKESKQKNRNYMRQPISKKRFLAYEENTTAKEKELLFSFALHEFLEHCWVIFFFCGMKPAPGVFPGLCMVREVAGKF